MKRFFFHFYLGNLATVFLVVLMTFAFVGVPSVFAYESSGWSNFGDYANYPPDFSCGGEKSLQSWSIMDESTYQPAIVGKVYVEVRDSITGQIVVSSSQTNVSETTPLCYDPTTQYFIVGITGNANYYNCGSMLNWGNVSSGRCVSLSWQKNADGSVTSDVKNKRIVGHIYVRPKSFLLEDKRHVSPPVVSWPSPFLNYDPSFSVELRDFPSNPPVEGVETPQWLTLSLYQLGVGWMAPKVYSISAKGTYTKGPFGLTDGVYQWDFSVALSASSGLGLSSSYSGDGFVTIDRVAPVVSTGISSVSPTSADTVTIYGIAQDVLSGLSSITVYIDGQSTMCPISGQTSRASCPVYVGPYAAGTTHSYYAASKDRAGNVSTSATGSFTVASDTHILKICPPSATISKGSTGTLRAWSDSAGSTMDCGALPSTAIDKTSSSIWSSNDTSFVTVNGGTVTGVNIGSANIKATYPGTSGDTVKVDVICIETVTCDSEQKKICSDKTVPAGTTLAGTCGTVDCGGEPGKRYCDFNWKEVAS